MSGVGLGMKLRIMKLRLSIPLMFVLFSVVLNGCTDELKQSIDELDSRVSALEVRCNQINSDIESIRAILEAVQDNNSITEITPIMQEGVAIGYSINFTKGTPITIYHGKDGSKGETPQIGVRQDSDGIYYWTIDGEWLLSDNGEKIRPTGEAGKNGISPEFRINNNRWEISTDEGKTWTDVGQATGDKGLTGDSFFADVDVSNQNYVVFTLSNGTQLQVPTWYAYESLQKICEEANANIASINDILAVIEDKDAITMIEELEENGDIIGYRLYFEKHDPINLYNGKDAVSPDISVRKDNDGLYYWTLNGNWMLAETGEKIKAEGIDGQDAISPQLKIEEGHWFISTDGGHQWTDLGPATGDPGKDGDDFFEAISEDDDYVYLTIASGETFAVSKHKPMDITFSEVEDIRVFPNKTYSIEYTLSGATEKTVVKALAQDGFRAVVTSLGINSGIIEVSTPGTIFSSEVLVFVSDGAERTIMRSINFVEGVINITDKSYTVAYGGGVVEVELSTNIEYTVEIPEQDQSWISVSPETKVSMRDETLRFVVSPNDGTQLRYSIINLVDKLGVTSETIQITQLGGTFGVFHVDVPGTLETLVSDEDFPVLQDVKITGSLNSLDYNFLNTIPNLKSVDLSELDDTNIPSSAFAGSQVSTVLLPAKLVSISSRAFDNSALTSLYLPETLESIESYAFRNTKQMSGDLVIPPNVKSIGFNAFQSSSFDGELVLPDGLKTINARAFYDCSFSGPLVIPNSVTMIGDAAFCNKRYSRNYTSLEIGTGLETLNDSLFFGSLDLKGHLIIPDNIKYIEQNVFSGVEMPEDKYVLIGSAVQSIGKRAFSGTYSTYNSVKVYCKALTPPSMTMSSHIEGSVSISSYPFGNDITIYNEKMPYLGIPSGTLSLYEDRWGQCFELIEEVDL